MKRLRRLVLLSLFVFVVGGATQALAVATGPAQGIAFDQDRDLAFMTVEGAVITLNVSDPGNPSLVDDSIQTQGVIQDLYYDAAQQRLYIAADEGDLEIWDLQDPSSPQQISVTPLYYFGYEVPAVSVEVTGDLAYVSTSWGYLHLVDVSDPANPVDLGFNGQGGNPSREVFVADDGFVYLAGPQTVRYTSGSLSTAGSNIYAGSYEIFAADGYAYITAPTGPVEILNATHPALPFVSTYTTNNVKDIFVAGDYAYLANGGSGLRIIDVADKANPVEVGFDDSAGAVDVVVSGHYAYVRGGLAFRVVDVSTPSNPVVIGTFDASGSGGGGVGNVAPTANAGLAQAVSSRARVTLDGSNSYDVDGTIVSYAWTQASGPTVSLQGANTAQAQFRAPKVRSYPVVALTFQLTVTDDDGATGSSEVTVTVLPRTRR